MELPKISPTSTFQDLHDALCELRDPEDMWGWIAPETDPDRIILLWLDDRSYQKYSFPRSPEAARPIADHLDDIFPGLGEPVRRAAVVSREPIATVVHVGAEKSKAFYPDTEHNDIVWRDWEAVEAEQVRREAERQRLRGSQERENGDGRKRVNVRNIDLDDLAAIRQTFGVDSDPEAVRQAVEYVARALSR